MNKKIRKKIFNISNRIEEIIIDLEDIQEIEESKLENIPDNLQNSALYMNIQDSLDIIIDTIEGLNEIIDNLEDLNTR